MILDDVHMQGAVTCVRVARMQAIPSQLGV
jgi:hypothetical protein